jgi:hypothetical protein
MRCITCGEQMRLVASVPDETILVPGYARQTLECPGCHEVECRLIFGSPSQPVPEAAYAHVTVPEHSSIPDTDSSPPQRLPDKSDCAPLSSPELAPVSEAVSLFRSERSHLPGPEHSNGSKPELSVSAQADCLPSIWEVSQSLEQVYSAESDRPLSSNRERSASSAWEKTIDKLRSRQIDLAKRAEFAWEIEFNRTWRDLRSRTHACRRLTARPGHTPITATIPVEDSRSERDQGSMGSTGDLAKDLRRYPSKLGATAELQFDELWEQLGQDSRASPAVEPNSVALAALPRSMSLVVVDAASKAHQGFADIAPSNVAEARHPETDSTPYLDFSQSSDPGQLLPAPGLSPRHGALALTPPAASSPRARVPNEVDAAQSPVRLLPASRQLLDEVAFAPTVAAVSSPWAVVANEVRPHQDGARQCAGEVLPKSGRSPDEIAFVLIAAAVSLPCAVAANEVPPRQVNAHRIRPPSSEEPAMQCLACGGEMILMSAVKDETIAVTGFEHHTFMCSRCNDIERRLVFTKKTPQNGGHPMPALTPSLEVVNKRSGSCPRDENDKTPVSVAADSSFAPQARWLPQGSVIEEPLARAGLFQRVVAKVWIGRKRR